MQIIELPEEIMMGKKPNIDPEMFFKLGVVAGGSVRRWFTGEKEQFHSDIDIFPFSNEQGKEIEKQFKFSDKEKILETSNAITYKRNKTTYQIISKYCSNVTELMESFDYCHCQFVWDGHVVMASVNAIVSSLRKKIVVHKFQKGYEVDSLRRAFKYHKEGYGICWKSLGDIAKNLEGITEEDRNKQIEISPAGGRRLNMFD